MTDATTNPPPQSRTTNMTASNPTTPADPSEPQVLATPYMNSWHVRRYSDVRDKWVPIDASVGNRSYALGYLNALDSFYPHPSYRLIDKDGRLHEERRDRSAPNLASGPARLTTENNDAQR